jgi:alkaline phosphatase
MRITRGRGSGRDLLKHLAVALLMVVALLAGSRAHARSWPRVRSVIILIPDGCSNSIQTLARWYRGEALALDGIQVGAVKTHMANSVIPGSAAAATAFATGHKTSVRFLSVGPRTSDLLSTMDPNTLPEAYKPIATVLEGAKLRGKALGLVATSRITHATPAAFASHVHDRGMDNEIMEHLVYQDLDVVLGGGKRHLYPRGGIDLDADDLPDDLTGDGIPETGGRRADGENLFDVLFDRGVQFVETKAGMDAVHSGRLWGLFNENHMRADMDRSEFAPHEPSLAEMATKAIELLSRDPEGFFLMIEGSQIDWAGHANDPGYMVNEFLAFDDAVKVALDFARADGRTLVLAHPDHDTGGLHIGHYDSRAPYTATSVERLIGPLKGMKLTASGVITKAREIQSPFHRYSDADLIAAVQQWWGLTLSQKDVDEIRALGQSVGASYALARVISANRTELGWTTHGHVGGDVPLWAFGPDRPVGLKDNTELAKIVAGAYGFDLDRIDAALFIDAEQAFGRYATVSLDESDAANPVLVVHTSRRRGFRRIEKEYRLPCGKDLLHTGDRAVRLRNIVVIAPMARGDVLPAKVFIPRDAVTYIRWSSWRR